VSGKGVIKAKLEGKKSNQNFCIDPSRISNQKLFRESHFGKFFQFDLSRISNF
jgi:hypothetical protein